MHRYVCALLSLLLAQGVTATSGAAQVASACADTVTASTGVEHAVAARNGDTTYVHTVWQVCGMPGVLLTTAWLPKLDTPGDYGARLVVLRRTQSGHVAVTHVSQGLWDSDLPSLRLFVAGERRLVLADLGSEGSWGLGVYELRGDSLAVLGILDVGLPAGFSSDPDLSAIRHARPRLHAGRWRVAFDTTVVLHPNQEHGRQVIRRGGRPVVFAVAGGEWAQVP